jgi:membrane protein implicated in regulation of membrane protease activity
MAMLVPLASLIIAAVALGAGLLQIRPGLLKWVAGSQLMGVSMAWWVAGGLFILMLLLLAVFNSLLSEKAPKPAGAYQKPKKGKAPKPEKKKKK